MSYVGILGDVITLAGGGSAGGVAVGSIDGTGSAAMFAQPISVVVSSSGIIYLSDFGNHRIRTLATSGTIFAEYLRPKLS